jgi:hypothetical protein
VNCGISPALQPAGDPAAAAAEIMEKQLVSKIGDAHPMAGVECPVCLDTPCELVWLLVPQSCITNPGCQCYKSCASAVLSDASSPGKLRRLPQVLPCNHGCCHICLDKLITRAVRLWCHCVNLQARQADVSLPQGSC